MLARHFHLTHWGHTANDREGGWWHWLVIQSGILFLSFLIANAIPFFGDFQNLVGALLAAPTMFGWPAFFYWYGMRKNGAAISSFHMAVVLAFLFVLTPFCTIVGTVSGVKQLIDVRARACCAVVCAVVPCAFAPRWAGLVHVRQTLRLRHSGYVARRILLCAVVCDVFVGRRLLMNGGHLPGRRFTRCNLLNIRSLRTFTPAYRSPSCPPRERVLVCVASVALLSLAHQRVTNAE